MSYWQMISVTELDELEDLQAAGWGLCRAATFFQWTHHHMTSTDANRPIRELAEDEGDELHRSELQHLKLKADTCRWQIMLEINQSPFRF